MNDPNAIINAYLDDELTEDQHRELAAWISQTPENRKLFVTECYFHSHLQDIFKGEQMAHDGAALQTFDAKQISSPRSGVSKPSAGQPALAPSHFPTFLTNTLPSSAGYYSGWPVAYLIATVVFGIGALIGTFTYVSQPVQIVERFPAVTDNGAVSGPQMEFIGRITGMIDCRWADESTASINGAYVPLGRKYSLSSGLMEITYDTGAKVVLQGPVTYEVESKDGGYLSVGKLTAKVEKKVASGQWPVAGKSEIRDPSHHPLFTIKTPTVIITDLGTEFGVEVDQQGGTKSHVFQGVVEVQLAANNGQLGKKIRLDENESVCVEKQQDDAGLKIVHGTVDSAIFVRAEQLPKLAREHVLRPLRRWQAYSEQLRQDPALVAYYTFESVGRGGSKILPNLSAAGSKLDGHFEGAEWVLGRFPNKYALLFHGPGSGDKVVLPDQKRFNFSGPFSIAVWFKVIEFRGRHEGLVTKGDRCWRFQQSSEFNELKFDTNYGPALENGISGQIEVADRQWHLGVVVYEPSGVIAQKRLYVDGRLDVKVESPLSLNPTDDPVWIGSNCGRPDREFQGWIDEVAIFQRALSAEDIHEMYDAGNPAASTNPKSNENLATPTQP